MKSRVFLAAVLFQLTLVTAVATKAAELGAVSSGQAALPIEAIGADDLLSLSVADCPELSKSFRVEKNGTLTLPMIDRPLSVSGKTATELSELIANELIRADVLVRPIVSVQVLEYRSRFVTVAGAAKHPGRLQISGRMTVLDALAAAEGPLPEAGPNLMLTMSGQNGLETRRIALKKLMVKSDSALNPVLKGGEEIRIPEAEKIYIAGNVKHPGAYLLHDGENASVLRLLAECEGTLPFSGGTAYVYRGGEDGSARIEIPIELSKLLARKSPDVSLQGADILYIPDHRGKRLTAQVIERVIQFGSYTSSQALVFGR